MNQIRTIVLIEDESEQRDALKFFLTAEGYNVYSYMSAEDALNNLSSIKPDLFVSDIKLPGMDGITFFHKIKMDARLRSVPFFFISAFNDPQTISSIKSLGAVAYITKPYDLDDIIKEIRNNIESPAG